MPKQSNRQFFFIKVAICLLVISNISFSKEITYKFLQSKPKSIYKDYYIWRYLDQNISSNNAFSLISEVKSMNKKLFIRFARKINKKVYKKVLKCYMLKPNEFLKEDADCIKIGFSIYDGTKLPKEKLEIIEHKIKDKYKKLDNSLKILSSNTPFKMLLKAKKDIFFNVFNNVGSKYRQKWLNKIIKHNKILLYSKNRKFNKTIKLIVTNLKLKNLQKSLLDINGSNLSAQSNFFLAMNSLKFNENKKALQYLDIANKKYYFRFDKDKVLFWKYLISNNLEFLYALSKSFDINIYSLYALHKLGVQPKNIVNNLTCVNTKPKLNIENPFKWLNILDKLNNKDSNKTKIAKSFKSCDELPFKAFALERVNYKRYNYFIQPYKKYLNSYSDDKKALILAIARQESRFIPASISSSYALGMMQFMPFLAKAIAKQEKIKDFRLDDMFNPEIAYNFSYKHIKYLQRRLKQPLFIAYAYNGGIGFTKRMLKSGFFQKGKFEPYLSMELVPYAQSRRYGKKVMANYLIYSNLLGEHINIKSLFQKLIQPSHNLYSQK